MSLKAAPSLSSSVRNSERGLPVLQLLDEHCMPIGQPLRSMYPTPINHTTFTVEQRFYSYACLTLLSAHRPWRALHLFRWKQHTPAQRPWRVWLSDNSQWACTWLDLYGSATRRIFTQRAQYLVKALPLLGATALTSMAPLQVSGRRVILTSFQKTASLCHLTGSAALLPTIFSAPPLLYRQWCDEPFYIVEGVPWTG